MIRKASILLLSPLLFLAMFSTAQAQKTGTIVCKLFDFEEVQGNLLITLYNKKKGFPEELDSAVLTKKVRVSKKDGLLVEFKDVPYGTYAIAGHHDANSNGEMDYNWIGMPKEGFCFSNNVKPVLSAPSFESAKFELKENQTVVYIHMQN